MPRNPKMRNRAEVESALRFAQNRQAAESAAFQASAYGSEEYRTSATLMLLWAGRIDAYEYVLRIESESVEMAA